MKPLIAWRKDFETGIPDVDHEHRQLIELINELPSVLNSEVEGLAALELLGDIYAQISAHFALEERLMRDRHFDEYQQHKADHDRLLDELRDLMDSYESGGWMDATSFSQRVGDWFSIHFRTFDARLHHRIK